MKFSVQVASLVLAVIQCCLPAQAMAALANGSFGQRTASGDPQGWRHGADLPIGVEAAAAIPGGTALRIDIQAASSKQGEVSQTVQGLAAETRYVLRGQLRSTTAGAGLLQIKRYRAGKEIERIASEPSPKEWGLREVVFTTDGADRIDVLCRTNPSERNVGSSAWFAALEIAPRPAAALQLGEVTATPTLHAVGLVVAVTGDLTPAASAQARYRSAGSKDWRVALPLVARPSESQFRGSLLELEADTPYEVEVALASGGDARTVQVRTWPLTPPIGSTVPLEDQAMRPEPYVLNLKGTPEAWIRVVPSPGSRGLIEGGAGSPHALLVENAAYVVVEGFTIRGGDDDAVRIQQSHDVLIAGCDIAAWGQVGTPNADGIATNATGKVINMQSGISVHSGAERIRVERNFIHAPRGSANSWRFGHPHGPTGISLSNPLGNIVVLDNDIIGSETHWWNDGIEGEYNNYVTGGPHRDTDYEGNTIAFANDDGMELDGGQLNVRSTLNLIRWTYCGVSCAPNRMGPSYVYRNVIVLGESREKANFGFKMGGFEFPNQGLSHLLNNTVVSHGEGLSAGNYGKGPSPIFARRNLYHLGGILYRFDALVDFDEDLVPPNGLFCGAPNQERHGLQAFPVFANEAQGDFRLADGSPGRGKDAASDVGAFERGASAEFPPRGGLVVATPVLLAVPATAPRGADVELTVAAETGASWESTPNSPWLRTNPSRGPCGGAAQRVQVIVDAAQLEPGRHRGAVTFRTNRGHLRTVFVTTEVPASGPPWSVMMEAENAPFTGFVREESRAALGGAYLVAAEGTAHRSAAVHFQVDVPQDGVYSLWARTLCEGPATSLHDSFFVSVDGGEPVQWNLTWRSPAFWAWQRVDSVAEGRDAGRLSLSKGQHDIAFLSREPRARLDTIWIGSGAPEDGYKASVDSMDQETGTATAK